MTALITGGGRGIGRAIAVRLAQKGWNVAIAARSANELAETVQVAGVRMLAITADVASGEQVQAMVQRAEQELGSIDLLVNNAGIAGPLAAFWETDPREWWRCQEVNVLGPMLCSRAVVPAMIQRGGGRIVNVSSGAGMTAFPNLGAYAVSKASLIRLSEQLALELAPYGIAVFPIRPGVVRTRMSEAVGKNVPFVQKALAEGRDLPPEKTAELVEYLASGKADALSGHFFAAEDDWDDMVRRADEIRAEQMYMLRVRQLDKAGPT